MPDLNEMEKRIKRIEDALRNIYSATEKRLSSIETKLQAQPVQQRVEKQKQTGSHPKAAAETGDEEPVIIEGKERMETLGDMKERIQELEDLLLLIELENTKMREGISGTEETAIRAVVSPDINERLNRIEEQLSLREDTGTMRNIEERVRSLEAKTESVDKEKTIEADETAESEPEHANEKISELKEHYEKEIAKLHERIGRLEKAPKVLTRVERTKPRDEEKSILEEVQMILKNK